jgi:hypothetical protein
VVLVWPETPLEFNTAWAPAQPVRLGEAMASVPVNP